MNLKENLGRLRVALMACTALSFVTAGCAALQSDGLGPAAARPAPDPLGEPQYPSGTLEFERNDGLDIINAEAAYARGATGAGVNVAVIDSGIDADHPDLDGNLSADSIDIITGSHELTDIDGHGTKVAGVVAAERDGRNGHGVAYDANLLAVSAYSCPGGCGYLLSDLASAVNYATDRLAHVINLSMSAQTGGSSSFYEAVRRATDAGAFVVIAAGNEGNDQPGYPANLAGDPGFDGMLVAVGAVYDSGSKPSWSNACGSAKNACLVAPGVGIETTRNGGGWSSASGTSFAAPHVSGALALLIQLYPDAYAADPSAIATFMYDGARDLGEPGVDEIYGHGLLDVAGAMDVADAAIAAAEVPLPAGGTASLADSSMTMAAAFGDALGQVALLDSAIAVIALSDGAHPYRARLDDSVAAVARGFGLDDLLAAADTRTFSVPLGDGLSLTMAVAGDADGLAGALDPWMEAADEAPLAMQLAGALGEATGMRLGIDVAAEQLGDGALPAGADGLFWSAGETMSPLAPLAGRGNGLGIDHAIGGGSTRLSVGLFEGETAGLLADGAGGGGTTLGQASLSHGFASGATLRLDFGLLEESSAMLGSQGAGAFATDAGASTRFVTVGGGLPIGRRLELLGSVTLAATEMGGTAGGVLSDWGTVGSSAFGIGAVARDVLNDGDRLGVLVGQPLRVHDADATVTVPVALTEDGQAVQKSERTSLTPSGREIDVQLAYDRPLAPGMDLSSWLLMQVEPGHDADAAPAYGAGLSFRLRF